MGGKSIETHGTIFPMCNLKGVTFQNGEKGFMFAAPKDALGLMLKGSFWIGLRALLRGSVYGTFSASFMYY